MHWNGRGEGLSHVELCDAAVAVGDCLWSVVLHLRLKRGGRFGRALARRLYWSLRHHAGHLSRRIPLLVVVAGSFLLQILDRSLELRVNGGVARGGVRGGSGFRTMHDVAL